jgi:hypothetical protein
MKRDVLGTILLSVHSANVPQVTKVASEDSVRRALL